MIISLRKLEFKYLGTIITNNNDYDWSLEVIIRIRKAERAYFDINHNYFL